MIDKMTSLTTSSITEEGSNGNSVGSVKNLDMTTKLNMSLDDLIAKERKENQLKRKEMIKKQKDNIKKSLQQKKKDTKKKSQQQQKSKLNNKVPKGKGNGKTTMTGNKSQRNGNANSSGASAQSIMGKATVKVGERKNSKREKDLLKGQTVEELVKSQQQLLKQVNELMNFAKKGPAKKTSKNASGTWKHDKFEDSQKKPSLETGVEVIVDNLSFNVLKSDIEVIFGKVAPVMRVDFIRRGTAKVFFKRLADAEKAVKEFHDRILEDRPMNVKIRGRKIISEKSKPTAGSSSTTPTISKSSQGQGSSANSQKRKQSDSAPRSKNVSNERRGGPNNRRNSRRAAKRSSSASPAKRRRN